MPTTLVAGIASASVTSSAEVDLLGINGAAASSSGIGLRGAESLVIVVNTTQNVTVNVYVAAGSNAGLSLGYTGTATSSAPYVLTIPVVAFNMIRATAKAASTTATVNCDLRAIGPA